MNRLFFENLIPGTVLFSRFKLLRCLSASDIGAVYLCTDQELGNCKTVIKVVSAIAQRNPLAPKLARELGLSRLVNHPNVLSGSEFFRDEDLIAYSMDYIESGSLADLMHKQSTSLDLALDALDQLCAGLARIHAAGIFHRDLKPDNILVTPTGQLKISDFGVALRASSECANIDQSLSGTLNYLAPEYLINGHYDARSDIYSVGVIAYELLTGRLPFVGDSLMETLMQRVKFDPLAPHQLNSAIPTQLSALVLATMHRDPEVRPADAGLLRDLFGRIRGRLACANEMLGNQAA